MILKALPICYVIAIMRVKFASLISGELCLSAQDSRMSINLVGDVLDPQFFSIHIHLLAVL